MSAGSRSSPDWLAPDGRKLRPPSRSGAGGPAYPAAAASRAAAASSSTGSAPGSNGSSIGSANGSSSSDSGGGGNSGGGDGEAAPRGIGAILSREEVAELRLLADAEEIDLPEWEDENRWQEDDEWQGGKRGKKKRPSR